MSLWNHIRRTNTQACAYGQVYYNNRDQRIANDNPALEAQLRGQLTQTPYGRCLMRGAEYAANRQLNNNYGGLCQQFPCYHGHAIPTPYVGSGFC